MAVIPPVLFDSPATGDKANEAGNATPEQGGAKAIVLLAADACTIAEANAERGAEFKKLLGAFIAGKRLFTEDELPKPADERRKGGFIGMLFGPEVEDPNFPKTPEEMENDPERPHFGAKQIRIPGRLAAGMKVKLMGDANAIIRTTDEEHATVSFILNKMRTKSRLIELVTGAYQTPDGFMVMKISFEQTNAWSGTRRNEQLTIHLSSVSILPRKIAGMSRWATNAWLERVA